MTRVLLYGTGFAGRGHAGAFRGAGAEVVGIVGRTPGVVDEVARNLDGASLEWGESDVEWSFTVMARLESRLADTPVSVLFKHGGLVPRFHEDHIVFYGTKGAIYIKGHYGSGQLCLHENKAWRELPLPDDIAASEPDVRGETEQCWHHLAREFGRDIRGETVEPYPTFREGSQYQQTTT